MMSDLYTEHIVKRKTPMVDQAKKVVLIALVITAAFIGLFMVPVVLIVAIALAVVCYFLIPRWDLEYEYLYVNGELDVDKIMARSKRKKVASFKLSSLEILAPVASHHMDSYHHNQKIKTLDYSSMDPSHKIYAMVITQDSEMKKVLFEPNQVILDDIKRIAPRKVFFD